MKDKRLDALLETLPVLWSMNNLTCKFYNHCCDNHFTCTMVAVSTQYSCGTFSPPTNCQGDIRKCEREE